MVGAQIRPGLGTGENSTVRLSTAGLGTTDVRDRPLPHSFHSGQRAMDESVIVGHPPTANHDRWKRSYRSFSANDGGGTVKAMLMPSRVSLRHGTRQTGATQTYNYATTLIKVRRRRLFGDFPAKLAFFELGDRP